MNIRFSVLLVGFKVKRQDRFGLVLIALRLFSFTLLQAQFAQLIQQGCHAGGSFIQRFIDVHAFQIALFCQGVFAT